MPVIAVNDPTIESFITTPELMSHFWSKVEIRGGCWIWTGSTPEGYGMIRLNSKNLRAHRISWSFFYGRPDSGLGIDHLCRTTQCVNPLHLELTTQKENILRGNSPFAKNAAKTHCKMGHEFTDANTFLSKTNRGSRSYTMRGCVECRKAYGRRRYRATITN